MAKYVARKNSTHRTHCHQVIRGYFSLHDWEAVVHITSDADFLVYIWGRNVDNFAGSVFVKTPPSKFRGRGSTGPYDGLGIDVPALSGLDLGCTGGSAHETIDLSSENARITIFVTVVTEHSAHVKITSDPAH